MQGSNSFKQSLLKHMLVGLPLGSDNSAKSMSLLARKDAIKLSADVAMALARGGTRWSRSLVTGLYRQEKHKHVLKSTLGEKLERMTKQCHQPTCKVSKTKILGRSFRVQGRRRKGTSIPHAIPARCLARRIAKKRIHVLKHLVPGGAAMDELSFLGETIDYVVALRAQVDVMRHLTNAVDLCNGSRSNGMGVVRERVGSLRS